MWKFRLFPSSRGLQLYLPKNSSAIDGTYIICSIFTIRRPLRFHLDIAMVNDPQPRNNPAHDASIYLRLINKNHRL